MTPIASAAPAEAATDDDCPAIELIVAGSETSDKESATLADVVDRSVAGSTDDVAIHVIDTASPVNFEGAGVDAENVSDNTEKDDAKSEDEKSDDTEKVEVTDDKDGQKDGTSEEKAPFPEPTEVAGKDDPRRDGNVVNLTEEFANEYYDNDRLPELDTLPKIEDGQHGSVEAPDEDETKDGEDSNISLDGPPFEADVPTVDAEENANDSDPVERITDEATAYIEQRAADCPDTQFVFLGAGEGAEALDSINDAIKAGDGPIADEALAGTVLVEDEDITDEQAAADKSSGVTRVNTKDENATCEAEDTEDEDRETHGLITSIHEALNGNPDALTDVDKHVHAAGGSLLEIAGVVDPAKVGSIATNAAIMAEAPNPKSGAVLTKDVLSVASAISNVWHDDPNLPNLGDFADLLDPKTDIGKDLLAGLESIAPQAVSDLEEGVAIARAVDKVGVDRVLEVSSAIADQSTAPNPTEWAAIGKDVATILDTLGTELDDPNLVAAAAEIEKQGENFSLDSLAGLGISPGEDAAKDSTDTEDC